MAYVSSFILLVGLFFMLANERGYGLPTNIQANDDEEGLTEKQRAGIREVLKLAVQEFKDEDIMQVLKESLELRFKVCFSPFSSLAPPPLPTEISDSNGVMEDEEFTAEQKKGLRELLLECLEYFDEEEMLDFLKHSIDFRVKYCPWPGDFLNASPQPQPRPETAPSTTSRPTAEAIIPASSAEPSEAITSPSIPVPLPGLLPEEVSSTIGENVAEVEQPTEPTVEYVAPDTPYLSQEVALEDELSAISRRDAIPASTWDETSGARIAGNDGTAKLAKRVTKKLGPSSQLARSWIEKDSTAKQAKRVTKKLGAPNTKQILTDLVSDRELTESLVSVPEPSETEQPQQSNDQTIVDASKEVGKAAFQAKEEGSKITATNSDDGEFASVKESFVGVPNPSETGEPEQSNDQTVVGASEEVGNVALQTKEESSEIMAANSDEGEFASVTRIDYNEMADEKPGVIEVDLGLIAESNEELS